MGGSMICRMSSFPKKSPPAFTAMTVPPERVMPPSRLFGGLACEKSPSPSPAPTPLFHVPHRSLSIRPRASLRHPHLIRLNPLLRSKADIRAWSTLIMKFPFTLLLYHPRYCSPLSLPSPPLLSTLPLPPSQYVAKPQHGADKQTKRR